MSPADPTKRPSKTAIWDLPTRLFHWLLAALVVVGSVTGYLSPEWWMGVHIWAGYGIVILMVFRLVWGVFGSEYSRVTTFAYSPREVARHLHGVMMMRPAHYIGHNPTGAMMIFALFIVVFGITVTGLLVLGGEENQGPLAGVVSYAVGDIAKDIHSYLIGILFVMIVVHVIGVIVESFLGRENLVRAMIDGYKRLPEGIDHPRPRKAHPAAAALTLGAFVLIAGAILGALNRLPPTGLHNMPVNSVFQRECGDCHQVYHPSLLPAASWKGLMQNLGEHFGEDASLDESTTQQIETYLATYASEAWDTEAANRLRRVSAKTPWRISTAPYWVQKHKEISKDVFARKGIGSKANCAACHRDAGSGRFDDQMINITKE